MNKQNYTLKETAKVLGIQLRTVRQWVKDGKLEAKKYDKCRMWFVSAEEIERKLNEMK